MAGERGWCLKTPGGFERGLDLSDKWLKLNWPARAPARQVCVLLGELDAGLLLMDTLEIALLHSGLKYHSLLGEDQAD